MQGFQKSVLLCCLLFQAGVMISSASEGVGNTALPNTPIETVTKKIAGPLQFRKQMIASESFESAGVFDVNNDGKKDIVVAGKDGLYIFYNEGYKL